MERAKRTQPEVVAGVFAIPANDPDTYEAVRELIQQRQRPTPEAIEERKQQRRNERAGKSRPDKEIQPPTDTI